MVSDWQAIEQYLIAKEQEVTTVDQQVPQMFTETVNMPHEDANPPEFYPDDMEFNKPVPVPVEDHSPVEQFSKVGSPDLYNLDQDSTHSSSNDLEEFYSSEEYYPYTYSETDSMVQSRACNDTNLEIPTKTVTVKSEQFGEKQCTYNNYPTVDPHDLQLQILYECKMEVDDVCQKLGINADPVQWTGLQVQQWISWQCHQANLPEPCMEGFYIPGLKLCTMSESEFRELAPGSASHLRAKLEIWLYVVQQMNNHYGPQITHIPVPRSPSPTQSSSAGSPISFMGEEDGMVGTPPYSSSGIHDSDRLPEEPVHHHRQNIRLWQFLKLLLIDGGYTDCIRWVDKSKGIFKIENSNRVAKLWGKRKNRPAMNYDKLSRSIRQYYKNNIIKKTENSKRLVYQFCK